MKRKNLQGGFAPLLIIAIIAILAIGGGAYVVTKNKEAKIKTGIEGNGELNVNANAKGETKGSLRSLLGIGKDTMCTFTSTAGGVNSSGSVFVASSGEMRGEFTSQTSTGTQTSSMIVKGGTSYVWSGSQGIKMSSNKVNASASAEGKAKSSVDLDSQVNYKCGNWTVDQSKFIVPTTVKFLDLDAMLKTSGTVGPGDINVKSATEWGY